MEENWKDIPGYEGLYQVSNHGRVKSLNYKRTGKERLRKLRLTGKGYYSVILKNKCYRVHRLVWEAFNGPIPDGMQVNHNDEDKTNNNLENLSLMTPGENTNYGSRNDKVCKKLGKWVIKLSTRNEILHFYPSTKKAAKENGLQSNTISECCNGKRKSYGGFTWKFSD